MASVPEEQGLKARIEQFNQLPQQKKIGFMIAAAAIIALLAGAWLWSQTPDYRVLYANIADDQEGGAIINALQQMNIPYKFERSGSTILVPGNQVHEVRLRLASQGLPKGGLASFELMENQKFGSSQFLEQVNYQRALEGELARSIQSISAVQSARVHLAISRPSVFARERKQPRASVLINLFPGRLMRIDQVNAIVHLVSSSVPNLPVMNVTVVDQDGNLLSSHHDNKSESALDAGQLEYIKTLEDNYTKRIEKILTPIVGAGNVRAQVTADVDFSRIERAEEIYRPNNTESHPASIRSQQNIESLTTGSQFDGGIPGALTNRPPEPAIAPIEIEGQAADSPPAEKPTDRRMESIINYEVDKTIQHTHQPIGGIKRLSAAVVVNYRAITGADGNITFEPLTSEEINDIRNLVREAMGYNEARGDTLAVTNSLFNDEASADSSALWKDPEILMLAKEIGKQLLIAAMVLFFLLKVLRPFLKSLAPPPPVPSLPDNAQHNDETSQQNALAEDGTPILDAQTDDEALALQQSAEQIAIQESFEQNLQRAKQLALEEPVIVANIVKEWVADNG